MARNRNGSAGISLGVQPDPSVAEVVPGAVGPAAVPVSTVSLRTLRDVTAEHEAVADPYSPAFLDFYRREYPRTVRLATLLCGSDDAGEDVAQDALLAVARRFDKLDSPAAYLRTSVVNLVRRRYREGERRSTRLRRVGAAPSTLGGFGDVELADIIAGLPHRQRVVVVGRYWAGWSEAELAELLGCRPGTVKSLASRALDSLRNQIGTGL